MTQRRGFTAPPFRTERMMTRDEILTRMAELEREQSEATSWGAAVGQRHEELQGLYAALWRIGLKAQENGNG